jgi:hypothetical protein
MPPEGKACAMRLLVGRIPEGVRFVYAEEGVMANPTTPTPQAWHLRADFPSRGLSRSSVACVGWGSRYAGAASATWTRIGSSSGYLTAFDARGGELGRAYANLRGVDLASIVKSEPGAVGSLSAWERGLGRFIAPSRRSFGEPHGERCGEAPSALPQGLGGGLCIAALACPLLALCARRGVARDA